jgi:threonine synthase
MMNIACTNCGRPYPETGLPYKCPVCGGLYDDAVPCIFDPSRVDRSASGIWRYRHTFGLPADLPVVTLGEGDTPLRWKRAFHRKIAFKCEYNNPTGSFKDRGTAVLANWVQARGVREVVEDSSGNAGASLAAYARKANIKARIFVPGTASGPKRRQIETYGAELVPISGSRSDVSDAVRREADAGAVYASHAYLPFNLPGYATAAYEIYEGLGSRMPGAVLVPAGQGGLLLGLIRGFEALRVAGKETMNCPQMIGVQARACAPLWAMFTAGREGLGFVSEQDTLAEGVKVRYPVRGDGVLRAVSAHSGSMYVVDENEIMPACKALKRLGFDVEPTSAIVWSALTRLIDTLPDPVVVVLTGAGYKYG